METICANCGEIIFLYHFHWIDLSAEDYCKPYDLDKRENHRPLEGAGIDTRRITN